MDRLDQVQKSLLFVLASSVLINIDSKAELRKVEEQTLSNGMHLYFIEDQSLPRVSFQALVKVGRIYEPASMYGVSRLVAEMLDQGTQKKTSQQMINDLADIGTGFGASVGDEYSIFSMDSLSNLKDKSFELYWEIMTSPRFTKADFSRVQSSILAKLKKQLDDPSGFASNTFMEYLWIDHPFGVSHKKEFFSIQNLKVEQVERFYKEYFFLNRISGAAIGS